MNKLINKPSINCSTVVGASKKRITFIDTTRGLLIAWMILSHSLGRAQVPNDHILQWIRPHGWATFGFVMISGFSLGYLFKWSGGESVIIRYKLWKRALQIGLVAYLSNLLFITANVWINNTISSLTVFKIATLQYPWGYSAILIPTTVMLIIAPTMLKIASKFNAHVLLIVSTILILSFDLLLTTVPEYWLQKPIFQGLFLRNGYVVFPVGKLILFAIWALMFGNWIRQATSRRQAWFVSFTLGMLAFLYFRMTLPYNSYNPGFAVAAARFPIILAIGIVVCNVSFLAYINNSLGLLGRSALLVYVFHRPFLQFIDMALDRSMTATTMSIIFMIATILLAIGMCLVKENNQSLNWYCKKVGL